MSNKPQATHDPTHNPTETINALRQGRVPDTRLKDLTTDMFPLSDWPGTDAMEPGKGRCDLVELSAERIRGLAERIGELYAAAYQVEVTEPPAWGNEPLYVRDAVKRCVSLLDQKYRPEAGYGEGWGLSCLPRCRFTATFVSGVQRLPVGFDGVGSSVPEAVAVAV